MYKRHKTISFVIFVLCIIIVFIFSYELPENSIASFVTFFSIIFGFYLTAISILYGSSFAKRISSEEDPKQKTQTKLHTLIAYFRVSSYIAILSIVLLLIFSALNLSGGQEMGTDCVTTIGIRDFDFCWQTFMTAILMGVIVVNIYFMTILFKIFLNAFEEEANA